MGQRHNILPVTIHIHGRVTGGQGDVSAVMFLRMEISNRIDIQGGR